MSDVKPRMNGDGGMSVEEKKVYDRQIRLWGHDGQNKLRTMKVLLIGMQGLGAEIAKNLILAGINSITLKDHTDVSILDRCSQFLIPHDSQERNRAKASIIAAQLLNPNVKVSADTTPIEDNDESFITSFDVVIATECSPLIYRKLSDECRKSKVKLFIADVYGLFGYFYQDLNFKLNLYDTVFPFDDQNNIVPIIKNKPPTYVLASALLKFQLDFHRKPNPDTSEKDIEELKAIIDSISPDEECIKPDYFNEYYCELFCELSPSTSIVGAVVAQNAINSIMGNLVEGYNMFFYDHYEHEGKFHAI
ncbi:SUMO-activating enzyme subunit 1 [Sipha flava]|uniref:SUMO-activating enzyme subunit 1 n=1 Tax=Sipha flava TaxID=143950 RepID=A0A2S2QAQ5_9HEMI|nr:SUMO-activating enzyme subunit 1 [Sipha flava]